MSIVTPAISIENLTKVYQLGESHPPAFLTLRETISNAVSQTVRKYLPRKIETHNGTRSEPLRRDTLFALNDVSFDVQSGEVVGVVGRNGAGKSTFLKILSRITAPTSGQVRIQGRIGSLLEVGTGFHPELSGRENIYLNGAILGMSRQQIARDFDAIVDFAEIERFLDTPVKRYSSGMYVRLAFAVASHLEPEVLIVDEVLAVGDAQFQRKCLNKMHEVGRQGRTVLFVSHNMAAIRSLCTKAVLLERGRLALEGTTEDVVHRYLDDGQAQACSREIPEDAERMTNNSGRIRRVSVTDVRGQPVSQAYFGQPIQVCFECQLFEEVAAGHFEVSVSTRDGTHVLMATTVDTGRPKRLGRGRHLISAELLTTLMPREYVIDVGVHHFDGTTIDFVPRACSLEVLKVAKGNGNHYPWSMVRGYVRGQSLWTHIEVDAVDQPVDSGQKQTLSS